MKNQQHWQQRTICYHRREMFFGSVADCTRRVKQLIACCPKIVRDMRSEVPTLVRESRLRAEFPSIPFGAFETEQLPHSRLHPLSPRRDEFVELLRKFPRM